MIIIKPFNGIFFDRSGEAQEVGEAQPSDVDDVDEDDDDDDDVVEVDKETGKPVTDSENEVSFHPQLRNASKIVGNLSDVTGRISVDKPEAVPAKPRHELIENSFAGSADFTGMSSIDAQVRTFYLMDQM